jgi:hypothetical protein
MYLKPAVLYSEIRKELLWLIFVMTPQRVWIPRSSATTLCPAKFGYTGEILLSWAQKFGLLFSLLITLALYVEIAY